jgi:hypothetical protein
MDHIVSLSGGMSSAVAAERVIERHGKAVTRLWFADTAWEDEDLYRFVAECEARWGMPIERFKDGRTPLEVAEKKQIIPNSGMAPCSYELKIRPFRALVAAAPKPITVHLGLDWTEQHRFAAPRRAYEEIEGVTVDFPLMWPPIEPRPYAEIVRGWGIEIPRLYRLGMPHNNCGGRCIRQGMKEWERLDGVLPERFAEVRDWEAAQRAKGGARAGRAILSDRGGGERVPITLAKLSERWAGQPRLPLMEADDSDSCFCTFVDEEGQP